MKSTIVLILSVIMFACGNSSAEKNNSEIAASEDHDNHQNNSTLTLDQGQKWQVNAEMLPPIEMMESLINDFAENNSEEYQDLASDLQKQIDLLVASCTMTGPSHDELHKWLHPAIQTVKKIDDAKDNAVAAQEFKNIQSSMQTYHLYFD
ncbi:MAG: hypothetical protein IPL46_29260 [Saprospiraceae bacterium]|nr:hypothetical protein [Saprospiraceae bacterium]